MVLLLVGCDSGPKGPGAFSATLEILGPPVGAAIIDVTGEGVRSFAGTGDTQVFHDVRDVTAGSHRLIVVSASGTLGFVMQVDRVEAGPPVATVIDATGTDNQPRGPSGVEVRFSN